MINWNELFYYDNGKLMKRRSPKSSKAKHGDWEAGYLRTTPNAMAGLLCIVALNITE
jgi:hypothetical protein